MAIVTFPIELGGSGLVVSDDTDPTTGLRNGGYLTRFVPALQQTVAVAGFVVGQANAAASSASSASGFATAASGSASSAAASAALAATLYDQFDDRLLGPKAANPTVDNDGNALLVGAMYFNTTAMETRVWNGTAWQSAATVGGTVNSLTVTGALEYQGTLTGGTGVINIGGGQLYKDDDGNFGINTVQMDGSKLRIFGDVEDTLINLRQGDNGQEIRVISRASGMWINAANGNESIIFSRGALIRNFTIDASGNARLGNGATSGWGGNWRGLTIDFYGDVSSAQGDASINLSSNCYNNNTTWLYRETGVPATLFTGSTSGFSWSMAAPGTAGNPITFINAAQLTLGRYFKASNTGNYFQGPVASTHEFVSDSAAITLGVANTNTGGAVQNVRSDLVSGAAGLHFLGVVNGVSQFIVETNGDVKNTTNTYGAISDPKVKDIIGSKSSTWEKTKQYNWIEYYLKSDTSHTFKMLGLNADEALLVSPGVVDETPDLVEVHKIRQVPVSVVRVDENDNPVVDEETGEVVYDEVMVDEPYTEWEPSGEFTKSVKYSVVSMQYHRTTQECQTRIESLEEAKAQTDDIIQQIMARVASLESASA